MDGQNSVLSVVGPLSHSVASLRLVVKTILSQQPWLHDPLCNEIPWRHDQEKQIADLVSSSKLAFGILKHDGAVTPHPPVQRALDIVVETLKKLGHEVIKWEPPSHKRGCEIILNSWTYDGGADIHNALRLSGEPMVSQISGMYGKKREEASASKIAANNIAKREYQKEYLEYWNSTAHLTATGRPVDAIIAPLAPFAAARPNRYKSYGYSNIYNTLDYTSCVVPVTNVDKKVDVVNKTFKPVSELDRETQEDYDPELYHGAHVAVQIVGRRLQEEKVLALSEYVGGAISESKDTQSSHL